MPAEKYKVNIFILSVMLIFENYFQNRFTRSAKAQDLIHSFSSCLLACLFCK